jgi:3-hydroxy-9,10-secoandrosta-1,3,5(10)-triene-9,17-dione monooxygenase reductase component
VNGPDLKEALKNLATAATVITTSTSSGPVGLTINSFNPASLDSSLVLWTLNKSAECLDAFTDNTHFAIHIMAFDQAELARRFATEGVDKFFGVPFDTGIENLPLFSGCALRFQCRTKLTCDGGDHLIILGEVLDYDTSNKPALIFNRRNLGKGYDIVLGLETVNDPAAQNSIEAPSGFTRDFMPYLLGRTHFQVNGPINAEIDSAGMDEDAYFILLLLSIVDGRTIANLLSCLEHTNHIPTYEKLTQMHEQGLVKIQNFEGIDYIYITSKGDAQTEKLLTLSVQIEERITEQLGPGEVRYLKHLLKKVIHETDPGIPNIWDVHEDVKQTVPYLRVVR